MPPLLPMPPVLAESRFWPPLDAQEASYLAASARMASLRRVSMPPACRVGVAASANAGVQTEPLGRASPRLHPLAMNLGRQHQPRVNSRKGLRPPRHHQRQHPRAARCKRWRSHLQRRRSIRNATGHYQAHQCYQETCFRSHKISPFGSRSKPSTFCFFLYRYHKHAVMQEHITSTFRRVRTVLNLGSQILI